MRARQFTREQAPGAEFGEAAFSHGSDGVARACANWGALALLVPGLDAWSCAEYMYARGSGRS